jgi:hypothetical protein
MLASLRRFAAKHISQAALATEGVRVPGSPALKGWCLQDIISLLWWPGFPALHGNRNADVTV